MEDLLKAWASKLHLEAKQLCLHISILLLLMGEPFILWSQ